jgi:hypothetical protein
MTIPLKTLTDMNPLVYMCGFLSFLTQFGLILRTIYRRCHDRP